MKNGKKGFSLVEVLIAVSISGILSYVLMHTMSQMNKGQQKITAKSEVFDIYTIIRNLTYSRKSCTASLDKVQFRAGDESKFPDIELYSAGSGGNKRGKKFYDSNASVGNIQFSELKLILPKPFDGNREDFLEGVQTRLGFISVKLKSIVGSSTQEHEKKFPLYLKLSTDSIGLSTVVECAGSPQELTSGIPLFNYFYVPMLFMSKYVTPLSVGNFNSPENIYNYLYVPKTAPLDEGKEYAYIVISSGVEEGVRYLEDGTKISSRCSVSGSKDYSFLHFSALDGNRVGDTIASYQGTFEFRPKMISAGDGSKIEGVLIAKNTQNCKKAGSGNGQVVVYEVEVLKGIMDLLFETHKEGYFKYK